jgi:hypothetical protein
VIVSPVGQRQEHEQVATRLPGSFPDSIERLGAHRFGPSSGQCLCRHRFNERIA